MKITKEKYENLVKGMGEEEAKKYVADNGVKVIEVTKKEEISVDGMANKIYEKIMKDVKREEVLLDSKGNTGGIGSAELLLKLMENKGRKAIITGRKAVFGDDFNSADGAGSDNGSYTIAEAVGDTFIPVFDSPFLRAITKQPLQGNTIYTPYEEPSEDGSEHVGLVGGAVNRSGWEKNISKISIARSTFNLETYGGILAVTDELLQDNVQFAAIARRSLGSAMNRVLTQVAHEAITGDTVIEFATRETANEVSAKDLLNLVSVIFEEPNSNIKFLIHPGVLPQFNSFITADNMLSKASIVNPMRFGEYEILKSMYCEPLGYTKDVIAIDMSKFMVAVKGNGLDPKMDVSTEVYFNYDMTAFRAVVRAAFGFSDNQSITINETEYGHAAVLPTDTA